MFIKKLHRKAFCAGQQTKRQALSNLPVLTGHVDLETIAGVRHGAACLPITVSPCSHWTCRSGDHRCRAARCSLLTYYLPVLAGHLDLETIAGVQHVQPAYLYLPVLTGHVDLETIAGVWHGAPCLPQYPISHWTCRS